MQIPLVLIILLLVTESFSTCWHSGALHKQTNESIPVRLPFALSIIKSLVLALGILVGNFFSNAMPLNYLIMAYAMIAVIGIKIAWESFRFVPEERIILVDNTKTLFLMSMAGSFNTFFIALSLGLLGLSILTPYLITLLATIALSIVGLYLGSSLGLRPINRYAGIISGVLILLISLRYFILYFLNI